MSYVVDAPSAAGDAAGKTSAAAAAAAAAAAGPAVPNQLDFDTYVAELEAVPVVSTRDVWSPFVRWSNQTFLGISALGGGAEYTAGLTFWKYLSVHIIMTVSMALSLGPALHVCVLGHDKALAFLVATLWFTPMVFTTPFAEKEIFRSTFLALHIRRGSKQVDEVRKGCSCYAALGAVWQAVFWLGAMLAPALFLALPFAERVGDTGLAVSVWGALGLGLILQFLSFGFNQWQPLVDMHQKEVVTAVRLTGQRVRQLLFDPSLSPARCREQLSTITGVLIKPLQRELRVWALELTFIVLGCVTSLCLAVFLVVITEADFLDNQADPAWAGELVRYLLAFLVGILMPCGMIPLTKAAARPHHEFGYKMEEALMDAKNAGLAMAKFDGSWPALEAWLNKNRLTLRLFGLAVDDELPGKLAAGLVSTLGVVAIVVARVTGG